MTPLKATWSSLSLAYPSLATSGLRIGAQSLSFQASRAPSMGVSCVAARSVIVTTLPTRTRPEMSCPVTAVALRHPLFHHHLSVPKELYRISMLVTLVHQPHRISMLIAVDPRLLGRTVTL